MLSRAPPSVSFVTRREVVEHIAPRSQQTPSALKTLPLDTVVAVMGYARKYAMRVLNQTPEGQHTIQRRRLPRYGPEVHHALLEVWKAVNSICTKRLPLVLPALLAAHFLVGGSPFQRGLPELTALPEQDASGSPALFTRPTESTLPLSLRTTTRPHSHSSLSRSQRTDADRNLNMVVAIPLPPDSSIPFLHIRCGMEKMITREP